VVAEVESSLGFSVLGTIGLVSAVALVGNGHENPAPAGTVDTEGTPNPNWEMENPAVSGFAATVSGFLTVASVALFSWSILRSWSPFPAVSFNF
jgi:hypothetical protein